MSQVVNKPNIFILVPAIYKSFCCGSIGAGVEKGSRLSQYQVAGILLGIFFFCLLVGASITVGLVLWVKHFKRNRRRKRTVRLPKGIKNELYHEVSLLSPGIGKSHPFEFPRSNVELQDILGMSLFHVCIADMKLFTKIILLDNTIYYR